MELLYQDSQIVLCVKPAGLSSEAGAGSLPELLEDQLGRPVFPVHRLDRNVGGVMVYARTRQAASALSRAVQAGNLQKEYLALIHGCPTQPAGTWEDLLWKDSAKNKVFVVRQMRKGVKAAKLAYRVLEEATPLTLVHIRLYTGRSHQIRVQFSSRGLPLLGDIRYGSKDPLCTAALWSCRKDLDENDAIPAFTPYLEMKLGKVACVPYAKPGSQELFDFFERELPKGEGFLLRNHGAIVGGKSIMEAFFRLEELEESARLAYLICGPGECRRL